MTKISNDTRLSRLAPIGLAGQSKPSRYREMLSVLGENKDQLPLLVEGS